MKRRLIRAIKSERGQAVPIVLVLLLLGGLLIAPSLSYAATSLNAGQIVERNVNGLYAADAGVEYALWCIEVGSKTPKKLPENVNQLEVEIKAKRKKGTYTLYYGELIKTSKHSDWLGVSGEMVWDEDEEAYKYTITATWQAEPGEPPIKLEEVGVRLPVGRSYQTGSAAGFEEDNLSTDEPVDTLDGADAHMLNWVLGTPRPEVSEEEPTQTQTFYITGEESEEEPEGDYAWVRSKSLKEVGEVVGSLYAIESTAKIPEEKGKKGKKGEEIVKVEAYLLKEEAEEEGGEGEEEEEGEGEEEEEGEWEEDWEEESGATGMHILSWQINPQ